MARSRGKQRSRRRESALASHPPRELLARGGLALGLGVLGYVGTASSLALVITKADPAQAYVMAPDNGVILADYAQSEFVRAPSKENNSLSASLARRALLSDPTAADALTVLGFQAQLRGEAVRADRIFSYSTALTRRELRPRLWAIEQAVERGDIVGALRNYDIALRTSRDASELLYPTLASAMSEPRIRAALLPILDSNPIWKDGFVAYAADSGTEPEGAIALFQEGRSIGLEPTDASRVNLVNTLFAQNKYNEAWAYYGTFRAGARRDRSRDPAFSLAEPRRAIFDWQPGADTRLSAAILRNGSSGLLDFSVPPSVGGILVSQTQLLPAGPYRLEGRSRGVDQPARSRPYWSLVCRDGRELGRVTLPNSAINDGRFAGRFVVPEGCQSQTLSLIARSTDDIMGISGQIESASLVSER